MKKGFTLTEVLIVMTVIGVIAIVILGDFKRQDYTTTKYATYGLKAIELVEQASIKIREIEKTHCPIGVFMSKRGGRSDFTTEIVDSSSNSIDASEVATLFGKYIRYDTGIVDFCTYSKYTPCSNVNGAKLAGTKTYIGFKVYNKPADCPAARFPNDTADTTPQYYDKNTGTHKTAQCWGELYIDVNGIEAPNQRGKDVTVIGLGEYGIAK